MDTVTHALVGAMTARACVKSGSDKRVGRTLLLAAAVSAAFPDIDYLLFWVNPYRFIAEWHRGITHSLLMLPVWAALLSAGAFFLANKRIAFGTLFGFCSLGLSAHIATDLITIYGIQLFSPLSDRRFALSLTFDLDPWLGLIALLGVAFGWNGRKHAVWGLIAIGCYLALLAGFRHGALSALETRIENAGISNYDLHALPQPFSPFHWKLVIDRGDAYDTAYLRLTGSDAFPPDLSSFNASGISEFFGFHRADNAPGVAKPHPPVYGIADFRPAGRLAWRRISKHGDSPAETALALAVWRHDAFAEFREFASTPILYRIDHQPDSTCVWYTDLRYAVAFFAPPFRYGMCRRNPDSEWRLFRLKRNTANERQAIE